MSRVPEPVDPDELVVHDRRKVDPDTGEVRGAYGQTPAAPTAAPPAAPAPGEVVGEAVDEVNDVESDPVADAVAELTTDLQRVTAEYANYRKRVERDRLAVVEMATAGLLSGLLPVLDDLDRARQHGDLNGALKGVADQLVALTGKLGLEQFGEVGAPFDPSVHEALMQAEPDPTASVATCAAVLQPGYRLSGGRVLRPARVSVAEPGAPAEPVTEPVAEPVTEQ